MFYLWIKPIAELLISKHIRNMFHKLQIKLVVLPEILELWNLERKTLRPC